MDVILGVERLAPDLGPVFAVVGAFDGLHLGHVYLLRHLVAQAARHGAAPMVITFDHRPDEVLIGSAPPLLMDPDERLERLAAAGVAITVVQHFDDGLRRTSYETFIEQIRARLELRGFVMTPDAAFGFERRGTPEALATLGQRDGFEVVVVPPFDLDGRPVRSSAIRDLIRGGDLAGAGELLGRPVTLTGALDAAGLLSFELPMAIPPGGRYVATVAGLPTVVEVRDGDVHLADGTPMGRTTVAFA